MNEAKYNLITTAIGMSLKEENLVQLFLFTNNDVLSDSLGPKRDVFMSQIIMKKGVL